MLNLRVNLLVAACLWRASFALNPCLRNDRRHISSHFLSTQALKKNCRSTPFMTATDVSTNIPLNSEPTQDISSSISQNEVIIQKRTPIGSEPEFYIPDDSTIETPSQRLWIAAHFSLFALNLFLFVQSALASVVTGGVAVVPLTAVALKVAVYAALTMASIILGDFAVSNSRKAVIYLNVVALIKYLYNIHSFIDY